MGKVVVAQGGGPTVVINQSLIGAVMEAKKSGIEILGARYGISGIVGEDFVNLSEVGDDVLERVATTPGSALGSTRDKPDEEYCGKILEVFKKHDIDGFFYIGGNDSSETIRLVLATAEKLNYVLKGFHIPKTVDNDLMENDHTPGFASAARFVAKAVMGIERDNASLPGVHLCIIMGRHAGFLTTTAALGGAHRVYVPEHPFNLEEFAREVEETFNEHGRAVIALSEGVQDKDGNPILTQFIENQEVDSHGNVQLSGGLSVGSVLAGYLKENTSIKRVRQDTFGYLQRSYSDVSEVDAVEARKVGEKAVQCYMDEALRSGSVVIQRVSDDPYQIEIGLVKLDKVANLTRYLPEEYYDVSAKIVTELGLTYLRPLVGELPELFII
jgi:ATP-dependent phosphofructokinase / diphosphate-dependent phosphofructokinase